MKMPSCLVGCFGGCTRPPSEADSSHLSVSKGPVPSGIMRSGFLSSFMSRRSCSRGTWDYSPTDAPKPRVRTRGDADIVTLATARYLELFATTPKNDETSTVLSEVQEAQDSMRSARTASENQVSRSSTFTARASREPSRLGANIQSQPAQLTCLPASSSQRFPAPSHRRGTSDASYTTTSPGRDSQQLAPAHGLPGPLLSRRIGSAPHVTSLNPFTSKTRGPVLARSRCRSDRISPSTAAYLLPAPSVKAIARAHTAIPATAMASMAMSSSTSLNDFSAVPVEGGPMEETATSTARRRRVRACTSMSQIAPAPICIDGSAGVNGTGLIRTSRLQTDNGSASGITGGGATAPPELGAAAQQWVQQHNQVDESATATLARANARGRGLPRRPSILFTRDGDVTVTGLPPSCLTAGRAPRGRGPSDVLASTLSTGFGCNNMASVTVPINCSALLVAGGSVDSASPRIAGGQVSGAREPLLTTVLMSSRSNDPGGRSYTPASTSRKDCALDVALTVTQIRQQQQQRRPAGSGGPGGRYGGVSMSCGANAVFMSTDATRVTGCCSGGEQFEGFLGVEREQQQRCQDTERAEAQQQQVGKGDEGVQEPSDQLACEEENQQPGTGSGQGQAQSQDRHEDKRLERTRQDGSQAFVLANSSSEGGHRCEWGCSSMLVPSRFSDSSRLTHGAATATHGTASLHSNNPLYCAASAGAGGAPSPPGKFGSITPAEAPAVAAAAAASTAAGARGDTVFQEDPCPQGAMLPAGFAKPSATSNGPSLLATEARDVTSALNRLQEACLAAVAQGDMRSQRLCRRISTDLPRLGLNPSQLLPRIGGGGDGFGYDRGSSMGPARVAASLGGGVAAAVGAAAQTTGSRMGTCLRTAASLPSGDGGGTAAAATVQGPSTFSLNVSVTLDMKRTRQGVMGMGAACGDVWEASGFGGDRASPEGNGIVIDGEMLDRVHFNVPDNDLGAGEVIKAAEAGPCTPGQGPQIGTVDVFEDADVEQYHNPVLNVLLRSDFLHETFEAPSEDEDDGVLEYRYGGFELGGGDHDCGFVRQASFMEAVRKCGASKAGALPAGLGPSQAGASEAGPMLRSATLALAARASRLGPGGTALQRKGSCLAAIAVAQPGLT